MFGSGGIRLLLVSSNTGLPPRAVRWAVGARQLPVTHVVVLVAHVALTDQPVAGSSAKAFLAGRCGLFCSSGVVIEKSFPLNESAIDAVETSAAQGFARQDEPHGAAGGRLNRLRAGVLGGNDGIVSVAGMAVGVAGATSSAEQSSQQIELT